MLYPAIDLTRVIWEAEHSDGKIIRKGPGQYEKINRKTLERIIISYEGKEILKFHVAGKVFFWRVRNAKKMNIVTEREVSHNRVILVGLLTKNKDDTKNRTAEVIENMGGGNQIIQKYSYDPENSKIYFIYQNAKIEIMNKYMKAVPYYEVKLRPEELEQLNGNISS